MLLTTTLVGCAQSIKPEVERELPPFPEFARPVKVAEPKSGEALLSIAARERAGRIANAKRINAVGVWYECLRLVYAQGGACK